MRLLLSLVIVVCAAEAAKKFEGTLRSAADAPPQDNLAIESGTPEPAVVDAPTDYQNPGAPPPSADKIEDEEEEAAAAAETPAGTPAESPVEPPAEAAADTPAAVPETASGAAPSAPSGVSAPSAPANSLEECDPEMIGFELVTG